MSMSFTGNYWIERRTRPYGRLKKNFCAITEQARSRIIYEMLGLNQGETY